MAFTGLFRLRGPQSSSVTVNGKASPIYCDDQRLRPLPVIDATLIEPDIGVVLDFNPTEGWRIYANGEEVGLCVGVVMGEVMARVRDTGQKEEFVITYEFTRDPTVTVSVGIWIAMPMEEPVLAFTGDLWEGKVKVLEWANAGDAAREYYQWPSQETFPILVVGTRDDEALIDGYAHPYDSMWDMMGAAGRPLILNVNFENFIVMNRGAIFSERSF